MRSLPSIAVAARATAAVLLAAALVGCSSEPPFGEVSGTVTFKGQPVTEGSITFINPNEGGTAGADIGKDGSFTVPGKVKVGEYIVFIEPPMHMVDTSPGKTPPSPEYKPAPNIPVKYRQQGTTPFKETVKEGKNVFTFDMKP
jgi:hypothetical protein